MISLSAFNILHHCYFTQGGDIKSDSGLVIFQGTLYTGLRDGRIVKLEGGKVIDVAQTGKPPCGRYSLILTGF